MDVNDYITEAEHEELPVSPIEEHKEIVNDTIETFRRDHLISDKITEDLI